MERSGWQWAQRWHQGTGLRALACVCRVIQRKAHGCESQGSWVCVLLLPLMSCVTLGRLMCVSESVSSSVKRAIHIYLMCLSCGVN